MPDRPVPERYHDGTAAQDHVVCGPDCQCGCEAGRTIPVRSAAQDQRDPFADDVLERLARSNQDYQRSHGHYIVPLAERLLAARAESERLREALTYYAEGRYPDGGEIAREALGETDGFQAQMLAGFDREKKLARLVTEAKAEAAWLRLERDLAYDELNKALGEHAPKAWDRIKARLSRV
jgi:hypothetical protein